MSPIFVDYLSSLLILISIIWIFTIILKPNPVVRKLKNLPPGPFQFPILGNILALGPKPHQSLAKLSRKHGPVMSLKLGSITAVVISSPETAETVFAKNDLLFSSRKAPMAVEVVGHRELSMAWLPVGGQWRKLRKICKEHMFSAARLDASQGLRKEKLDKLREFVGACSESGRAVDIGDAAFTTSLNLISATLFSLDLATFDSASSQEMKDVVWGVMKCVGSPNLADYFPVLKRFDPQGILRDAKYYFGKQFEIFDRIIDDKLKGKRGGDGFVEALIDLNQSDELSRDDINHLLLKSYG
ncbi:ferruginol synthase [Phtheirospermum japonicum]|uniref:Ferruginol synthase n=1 Tax=Phtheirospermum japonicum TaxID=374723 RepID=A0A830BAP6_9LAMI|nr:ferruginol synthase [Phtheirospermum japonicum]